MIDPKLLPARCMLDTGVWIRALGQRNDERSGACRAFFEAMIGQKNTMLMAAPSLAEILRGDGATVLPSTRYVQIVPFDRLAATLLGQEFPQHVLVSAAMANGAKINYMKYDALILACAKRWDSRILVAYDDGYVKLARHLNSIAVQRPDEFEDRQGALPGVLQFPTGGQGAK